MSNSGEELITASARLARMAPREWDEFKKAFRKYESAARDDLVRTQVDLSRFQGMALQCSLLGTLYDNALTAADQIEARKAAKGRN